MTHDARHTTHDAGLKVQGARRMSHDTRHTTHDTGLKVQGCRVHDAGLKVEGTGHRAKGKIVHNDSPDYKL